MDSPPTDRVKFAGTAAGGDVPDILDAISQASARTINSIKVALKPRSLRRAVGLLGGAGTTCVLGCGDAFPVAALLANGLKERGRTCDLFGPDIGAVKRKIGLLGSGDLLVLVKLPEEDGLSENILAEARAGEVPVLAIAEPAAERESERHQVDLPVPRAEVFGTPVLAGHMTMAQLLLIALDQHRAATGSVPAAPPRREFPNG